MLKSTTDWYRCLIVTKIADGILWGVDGDGKTHAEAYMNALQMLQVVNKEIVTEVPTC